MDNKVLFIDLEHLNRWKVQPVVVELLAEVEHAQVHQEHIQLVLFAVSGRHQELRGDDDSRA